MKKLRDLIPNHQYAVYCGVTASELDLSREDGDFTTTRFERAADMTLGEIKGNHPGLYQVIKSGGVDGLSDDYAISVYEIDDSAEIYVVDDWM